MNKDKLNRMGFHASIKACQKHEITLQKIKQSKSNAPRKLVEQLITQCMECVLESLAIKNV